MVGIVVVLVMMVAARFWNSVPKMWFWIEMRMRKSSGLGGGERDLEI